MPWFWDENRELLKNPHSQRTIGLIDGKKLEARL